MARTRHQHPGAASLFSFAIRVPAESRVAKVSCQLGAQAVCKSRVHNHAATSLKMKAPGRPGARQGGGDRRIATEKTTMTAAFAPVQVQCRSQPLLHRPFESESSEVRVAESRSGEMNHDHDASAATRL
jgi:hypothetical protein